jgi:hypothetical protein
LTGRARIALAIAATTVAVVGVAVHPLLDAVAPKPPAPNGVPTSTVAVVPAAGRGVATAAASRALACEPVTPPTPTTVTTPTAPPAWCGRFTATRSQSSCVTRDECTVQLLGTLVSPAATTVVALTVTVVRRDNRWHVVAVNS